MNISSIGPPRTLIARFNPRSPQESRARDIWIVLTKIATMIHRLSNMAGHPAKIPPQIVRRWCRGDRIVTGEERWYHKLREGNTARRVMAMMLGVPRMTRHGASSTDGPWVDQKTSKVARYLDAYRAVGHRKGSKANYIPIKCFRRSLHASRLSEYRWYFLKKKKKHISQYQVIWVQNIIQYQKPTSLMLIEIWNGNLSQATAGSWL